MSRGEERQAGHKLAIHVFTHEQLDPPPLLDVENAFGHTQQLLGLDLEQLITGIQRQDLFELLAGIILPQEAGFLHHQFELAAQQWDFVGPFVVGAGGVQAEEAALAHHFTLAVEFLHRDVIRVGRAVNAGPLRRFGKNENVVGAGHLVPGSLGQLVQPHPVRTLVVDPQNAEFGILHPANHHAALVLGEVVFVVPEKGKTIPQQPGQKRPCFFLVVVADACCGGVQFRQNLVYLAGDHREILDGDPYFVEDGLQHLLQLAQILRVAVAINLQHNERFVFGAGAGFLGGMQFLQLAVVVAVDPQDRMLDRMGTDFPLVDGNAQGNRSGTECSDAG